MAKLWTPQEVAKLRGIAATTKDFDSIVRQFRLFYPHRSPEGIRSQLRLLKHGAEAAKSYVMFDVAGNYTIHPTLTAAKEHAKKHALTNGKTTVAALICSFEVEQKIIEKAY